MPTDNKSAIDQYVGGDYESRHPDWHLADAPNKAADLQPALEAMLRDAKKKEWRIVDIGAGAGGVLDETVKRMAKLQSDIEVHACGIEISSQAVAIAGQKFPHLDMRQKFFEASDGPFDA